MPLGLTTPSRLRDQPFCWSRNMKETAHSRFIVRSGDMDGLNSVYASDGTLIPQHGESIVKTSDGWDMEVSSPWRRLLPNLIFTGFAGTASSRLYITSVRIVLLRDIDSWRELKGELTPLGIPNAAAKEVKLRKLRAVGARQYCEIFPQSLRIVRMKRSARRRSWMDLRLIGADNHQYTITLWKTNGTDEETASLIESMFPR